jgi:Spy/CpxP family protein refolding chaperone
MKVFKFLMLFLVAGAVAQAQTVDTEKKEKARTERKQMHQQMQNELNLTAEQKAQMKAIHEKQKAEMTAIKNNSTISAERKKEQFKTLKQQYRTQRETVFTAEQKEKMKKFHAQHPNKKGMKHKRKMHEKKTV